MEVKQLEDPACKTSKEDLLCNFSIGGCFIFGVPLDKTKDITSLMQQTGLPVPNITDRKEIKDSFGTVCQYFHASFDDSDESKGFEKLQTLL